MSVSTLAQVLLPNRYRRLFISLFFGGLLALGLGVFRDYSLPGDEELQRITGEVSLLYVFRHLPAPLQQRLLSPRAATLLAQKGAAMELHRWRDRDYGVVFELPAAALEQALRLHEPRQFFLLRHLLNFLVCYAGFVAFYRLAARRFASWRVGLLGALLLALSPRLFGDLFYNSKDAVFLAMFTLALAAAQALLVRPTWRRALAAALMAALAIDVRLMGVLVPAATLAGLATRAVRGEYPALRAGHLLVLGGLYVALLAGVVVGAWPFLWEAPLHNFALAWHNMSRFRWHGEILYQGHMVSGGHLPWHYVPVWILLTVPLLYLLFFGVGMLVIVRTAVRRRWRLYTEDEWQDLLFLGLTLAPIAAVVSLHSVLYNGWRQLYFLYPPMLLVALRGLVMAWRWQPAIPRLARYWQPALVGLVAASLSVVAGRMVRLHPLETLYFNALAPSPIERYYETDYWGMSLRNGLEWLLEHDSRPRIRVASNTLIPIADGQVMLPPTAQNRIVLAEDATQADYYFDTFAYPRPSPYRHPRHTMWADNVRLMDIYQLTPPPTPAPRAAGRASE